jgi:hypothetical protein
MNLKSKPSHPQNIWNDDIGDTCPLIPITNKLNTEKHYLKNDFIIQSCNIFYHIHKILKMMVSQYHPIL